MKALASSSSTLVAKITKFVDCRRKCYADILFADFCILCRNRARSIVGSASDARARGLGLDTRSGHILSFLLPLIQEGQLSVTGESMCTKY